jgi:hypothetical protein
MSMALAADPTTPALSSLPSNGVDNLAANDLSTLTIDTMRRGAIAHTLSTLKAAHNAQQAINDDRVAIAQLYRSIAIDDARHAALAWRTLAWAVAQDSQLIDQLQAIVDEQITIASNNDQDKLQQLFVQQLLLPLSEHVFQANVNDVDQMLQSAAKNDRQLSQVVLSSDKLQSQEFVDDVINTIIDNVVVK